MNPAILSVFTLVVVFFSSSAFAIVETGSSQQAMNDDKPASTELMQPAIATQLQGYGAFTNLNKDWMLMALYTSGEQNEAAAAQRLEIKISTEKFSTRRFRALWLETLAIEHSAEKIASMEGELEQFFNSFQGPLLKGDSLIIERIATPAGLDNEARSVIKMNYHTLATLSPDFLSMIVQSLVGSHPPTQALKTGLTGEDSLKNQARLSTRFERLEPSLPRIVEISRWGKRVMAVNTL